MRSRLSRLPRSKKMRVVNNYQKPCVFTWFSHARACAHSFKIVRKSFPTRLSNKSRDRSLSKDCFFELSTLKCFPEIPPVCFWRPLGALLGYLGRSWATLGALLGALGALLDALGPLLGRSWDALGRSWDALRRSWDTSWCPWAILDRFWSLRGSILEPLGVDLGASRY